MGTTDGRESRGLADRLFQEPFRFDFFQAVRVLERLAHELAGTEDDPRRRHFPVGQDHPPEQEAVRFRAGPSLSFPSSAVVQCRPLDDEAISQPLAEMVVSFMGLIGPSGVLPHHYTSLLMRRIRIKDFALRDFLDLFHHRVIALFYRSWVKYRLPFAYERSKLEDAGKEDLITWALYCLVGLGTGGLRQRLEIDDEAFLYYAGHFAHFPRSAVVLESILVDYFGLPIQLCQLQGQWLQIDVDEQASMPTPVHPRGLNNELGRNLVVGDRVWDIQSKFRLRIGPLTYAQFQRFLPNGDALKPLCQMVRKYVGPEFDFDVQLVLRADEVPATQAGKKKSQLGWNTWVRRGKYPRDADDAIFSLESI